MARNSSGRPTKWRDDFVEKADEYLKQNQDQETEKGIKVSLPTISGFAVYLGATKETLYEWAKKYPEFSDALRKIKQEQKKRLLDKGLSGQYNPTIAKLVLSANHGMREKTETDLTSKGDKIIPILPLNNVSTNDSDK